MFLDLNYGTEYSVEFLIVKLDNNCRIIEKDPTGKRVWVLPHGHCAYSMEWGKPEAAALSWEDLPTKEADGVDLALTAWTSHVVGHIKSLHLPTYNPHSKNTVSNFVFLFFVLN